MDELPAEVAASRDRLIRWSAWCAAGRCRYADLPASEPGPRRVGDSCPGYTGTLRFEEEEHVPVIRVRPCPHRVAWWARRQAWLREHRVATKRIPDAVGVGWRRRDGSIEE